MNIELVKQLGDYLSAKPWAAFLTLSVLANVAQWVALQRANKAHLATALKSVHIAQELTAMVQAAASAAKKRGRR